MAKDHALATIAASGMGAIQAARADLKTQKPGLEAIGEALALRIIETCKASAATWTRYYADLCKLDPFGRKAFQRVLQASVKDSTYKMGTCEIEDARRRSAKARISEFNTIARAMGSNIAFDPTWSHHYAYGHAKVALRSQGTGSTRGPKTKPFLDKLKAYLEKNVPAELWGDVSVMVQTMAKVRTAPAPM